MADRLEDLLRACTVRVDGDRWASTGFFVAPNMVITAAHVGEISDALTVFWERDAQSVLKLHVSERIAIVVGEERPIAGAEYYYPNIAVLAIKAQVSHPCVRIDPDLPIQGDDFLSYVYSQRGGAAVSTSLLFSYQGIRGSQATAYLDLAADKVRSGMTGSAILNLRTRNVCGILVASYDQRIPARAVAIPWRTIKADIGELLAANRAFHKRDKRWSTAARRRIATQSLVVNDEIAEPDHINTRQEFGYALNDLRRRSGIAVTDLALAARVTPRTLNAYFSVRRLPRKPEIIQDIIIACGVRDPSQISRWLAAFERVRALPPDDISKQAESRDEDQTDLLFRVYIPAERLYAAEAHRLLSLFRDWLIKSRRHGIRQAEYHTASGEMYEFFADPSLVQTNLREEIDSFSNFLTLSFAEPSLAVDTLVQMGLERTEGAEFVVRFTREMRRLQIDLAHERERRILTIRHNLEEQLADSGINLSTISSAEISTLIEKLVPGPSARDSLALLAAFRSPGSAPTLALNINQQFINAAESTIIQNVRGTVHLGPHAKELLELINRLGGQDAPVLEAAVHELEDTDARPIDRMAAKRRLKKFLNQIAGMIHDAGLDLIEKYLESKIGL